MPKREPDVMQDLDRCGLPHSLLFAEANVRRYLESGEHDPQIAKRLAELFLSALPFAELGFDLRDRRCHRELVETKDCARCAAVIRLRAALDAALP